MSPAEQANADQIIETIYTTVETQPDRTDWLTVVSNLRQINRQLVEEIARLEQALASAKQTVHTHKEQHQIHEITILQQQDELKIAKDRLGSLFQQLETSHQIGQRQQTLIETLSQQLEIVQTIVPQIEAEHEELRQKYQQQSQKLVKTERVAIELHRRLKLQANTTSDTISADLSRDNDRPPISSPLVLADSNIDPDLDANPDLYPVAATDFDSTSFTTELDPAPPSAPLQIDLPNWTSPSPSAQQISSISNSSAPTGWREAILQDRETRNVNRRYNALEEAGIYPTETIDKESTSPENPISQSSSKWPSPTIVGGASPTENRDSRRDDNLVDRPATKAVKIDLPKFPKKPEN
ncbi:hypothetical protein [Chamaesiphon sp. VAR_48_metabat_403]|uniref:hypothetical protein n=1 Tax=Chamaesiphon sp. VAR_48_metabat_403 TaxID=2964700 RepID=UPI00286DE7E0|nr:hypothetical protein [Chamaesiphon sp. VAR_48_metabat_403]